MLNAKKLGLLIFDNIEVDRTLPKYEILKKTDPYYDLRRGSGDELLSHIDYSGDAVPSDEEHFSFATSPNVVSAAGLYYQGGHESGYSKKKNIFARIFNFLFGWLVIGLTRKKEKRPKISVGQFFALIKGSIEKIEVYEKRVNSYLAVMREAQKLGQTSLVETIKEELLQAKYESQLLASGFDTCITEQQVVDFYKESDKGISLCYVKNFMRVIPSKVIEQKQKADAIKVFDNYVILYYDLTKKAFKLTQKEKEDPILFGVIKGINKLYYIADWADESCDLTLQQFIDKFGQDAIKANDITVNYSVKKDKEHVTD